MNARGKGCGLHPFAGRPVVLVWVGALCAVSLLTSRALTAECNSADPTSNPYCYRLHTDGELERLLGGTAAQPFDPPEVCGVTVTVARPAASTAIPPRD